MIVRGWGKAQLIAESGGIISSACSDVVVNRPTVVVPGNLAVRPREREQLVNPEPAWSTFFVRRSSAKSAGNFAVQLPLAALYQREKGDSSESFGQTMTSSTQSIVSWEGSVPSSERAALLPHLEVIHQSAIGSCLQSKPPRIT